MLVTINLIVILSLYLKKLSYYIFLAAFLQFPPKGRVPKLLNKAIIVYENFIFHKDSPDSYSNFFSCSTYRKN